MKHKPLHRSIRILCHAAAALLIGFVGCGTYNTPRTYSSKDFDSSEACEFPEPYDSMQPPKEREESAEQGEQELDERIPAPLISDFWDVSDVDISYVCPTKNYIAFTFDDAPARTLESILAVFASFNEQNPDCPASATLFCNGIRIDGNMRQLLSLACTLRFELGNHSYSHRDLTALTAVELCREIEETDKLLASVDGKPLHLFRAPFGKLNETVKATVAVPMIDWTIDTLDWTGKSAEAIYNVVWESKFPGAIVLMHDGYAHTVSALKRLLPDLKEAGYQVLGVSAMAKANDCPLKRGGVYIRARKNGGGK